MHSHAPSPVQQQMFTTMHEPAWSPGKKLQLHILARSNADIAERSALAWQSWYGLQAAPACIQWQLQASAWLHHTGPPHAQSSCMQLCWWPECIITWLPGPPDYWGYWNIMAGLKLWACQLAHELLEGKPILQPAGLGAGSRGIRPPRPWTAWRVQSAAGLPDLLHLRVLLCLLSYWHLRLWLQQWLCKLHAGIRGGHRVRLCPWLSVIG